MEPTTTTAVEHLTKCIVLPAKDVPVLVDFVIGSGGQVISILKTEEYLSQRYKTSALPVREVWFYSGVTWKGIIEYLGLEEFQEVNERGLVQ